MKAGVRTEMVEAFDINDLANDVYEHNFGHRPFQVCPLTYHSNLGTQIVYLQLKYDVNSVIHAKFGNFNLCKYTSIVHDNKYFKVKDADFEVSACVNVLQNQYCLDGYF